MTCHRKLYQTLYLAAPEMGQPCSQALFPLVEVQERGPVNEVFTLRDHLRDQLVVQQKHSGWRKLLRKVERGSTLSNKFWFCFSFSSDSQLVAQQICSCPRKSTNQRAAFLPTATNVFVAGQSSKVKNAKHRQKLATKQCYATSLGFLYLVFRSLT